MKTIQGNWTQWPLPSANIVILILSYHYLIYFHDAIDAPHEPEASHETYGPCQQEEQEDHNESVTEVQESRSGILDVQFCHEIVTAVDEEVTGSGTGTEESAPPPVIVLGAQMEVAEQDRCLRAGDHEYHEHEEQESEHVVHLTGPKRVKNEEQLNKDTSEW